MSTSTLSQPVNRRDFLKLTGIAGGGFALSFYIRSGGEAHAAESTTTNGEFAPNAFVRISPVGTGWDRPILAGPSRKSFLTASIGERPPAVIHSFSGALAYGDIVRERLAEHRANAACATCHNMMDPVGLALENYDVLGRWRDEATVLGAMALIEEIAEVKLYLDTLEERGDCADVEPPQLSC